MPEKKARREAMETKKETKERKKPRSAVEQLKDLTDKLKVKPEEAEKLKEIVGKLGEVAGLLDEHNERKHLKGRILEAADHRTIEDLRTFADWIEGKEVAPIP